METLDAIAWLKQQGLYEQAVQAADVVKKVYPSCLSPRDEKILVVGDTGISGNHLSSILSGAYYLAARDLKYDAKLLLQEPKARGEEAEEHVINGLTDLREGIIILNKSDKLGSIGGLGKSFRKFVTKKNHRFVSAMGLGDLENDHLQTFLDAMTVSYKPFQAQHEELKKLFDESKEIRVTTKAGTDLHYNIEGINGICAHGSYHEKGTGGNLPAGEVYAPPNGTKVNGKIVIDGSSRVRAGTIKIKHPITLTIENGSIVNIEGRQEAQALEATLDWASKHAKNPGSIRRICEFGIGLNPKAKVMGAMIIDDKTLGTAHVGIGSNYWFGGSIYAIIHLDQVFRNPDIYFDGRNGVCDLCIVLLMF